MSNVGGEFVTIRIKVNADTREINRVNKKLAEMGVAARLADKSTSDLSAAMTQRFDPAARKMKSRLMSIASALSGFNKLALKVFGVTFIVAAASLASVNALFATGRFLVQAYRVTMQALAVGVTAVGAGLATVAAAQREYNAALYAYSYKASPALGKGMNQSRAALRMLQSDSTLAVFGMEALNSSFATLSKSGQVTGRTVGALRAFADFAAAGGDPAANLQGIAEVLALIEKKGKLTGEAITMAGDVNLVFAEALNKANRAGKTSYADLVEFIESSGIKAQLGIEGQSELLGNTLVGKFKIFTTQIRNLFADIGQPLLGPVSEAFEKMFRIIRLGILRLAPDFIKFGSGRMLDGLVNATQKLTDSFVNLTRKYLGGSEGMIQKFNNFWQKTVYVFNRVVDSMRPLLDGGRAVIDIFGPVLGEVFGKVGDIIKKVDELIVGNSKQWAEFGNALKGAVTALGEFIELMFDVFNRALPIITPLIEGLTGIARAIMSIVDAVSKLGPMAALFSMFGLMIGGKGIKNFAKFGAAGSAARSGAAGAIGNAGNTMAYIATSGQRGTAGRGFLSQYATARSMGDVSRLQSAKLAAEYSGIGGKMAGFGKSFGPGLALSLLAPMVGREAQGGVAAGSMIASLAPLLGAAGPAAALLGTGVAGLSIARNATTMGGGALGGAMTGLAGGAAAGAAIGMIGGPIGAVGGAIIGTATGAIIGAFQARSRGEKKKVKTAVEESTGELYNTVANAMGRGDTKAARTAIKEAQRGAERLMGIYEDYFTDKTRGERKDIANRLVEEGKITEAEAKNFMLAPGTYAKGVRDAADKTEQYLNGPLNRYDKVVSALESTTGKTGEEIKNLADSLGINLYDDSVALTDVIKQMGSAMAMTGEQIKQSMYDMAIGALGVFDEAIQKIEAESILNEQVDAMREMLISGSAQEKDMFEFVKSYGEQLMVLNPDKPLAVIQELFDQFGIGGYAYEAGKPFEGFSAEMTAALEPMFAKILETLPGAREDLQEQIAAGFLARGYQIDGTQLSAALAQVTDFQDLQTVLTALSTGGMFSAGVGGIGVEENLQNILRSLGITTTVGLTPLSTETPRSFEDMSAEESAVRAEFFSTVSTFFAQQPPAWMTSTPPWWDWKPGGDTSTPRGDTTSARLGRTLSRHNSLNSQIAGKRTISSAYRTNNLGSINSDHIMGRAYDLVGQNLGAYSKLVNDSGGFAEFHGFGGGRHLHVVPGDGPMGDTSLPSMATYTPVTPSSNTNNFNITVNGGSDSAQTIARHVMDEIARAQRSARERR